MAGHVALSNLFYSKSAHLVFYHRADIPLPVAERTVVLPPTAHPAPRSQAAESSHQRKRRTQGEEHFAETDLFISFYFMPLLSFFYLPPLSIRFSFPSFILLACQSRWRGTTKKTHTLIAGDDKAVASRVIGTRRALG